MCRTRKLSARPLAATDQAAFLLNGCGSGRLYPAAAGNDLGTRTVHHSDIAVQVGAHHFGAGLGQLIKDALAGMAVTVVCSDTDDRHPRPHRGQKLCGAEA